MPNVLKVLQKVKATELSSLRVKFLMATLTTVIGGLIAFDAGFSAAETLRKLTGKQIWVGFAGMQLTDEVHYRLVYERDGTPKHRTGSEEARQMVDREGSALPLFPGARRRLL